ncbi:MAG: glycosyltransferase family 4 protein [Gemmatimonadetes bacterium]|nr:glycosyltransferase family 4 protein [Gemmatimonadota bacterium]MBA4157779.1 glycosyltransferase family 4 protein [Gemmatimonadota bacterium]
MNLCIDAGAVENAHRERGIGRCTYELLRALTREMVAERALDVQYLSRFSVLTVGAAAARHAPRSAVSAWTATHGRLPYQLTERWKPVETRVLLAREVAATGADVFLATDPQAVAISRRFRTVALLYDLIPLRFPAEYLPRSAPLRRASFAMQCRAIRQASRLIAISEATRRDAVELLGIPASNVEVVPLAVDAGVFQPPSPAQVAQVLALYGIDRSYFFYVGGFDARKNVAMMVEAFLSLASRTDAILAVAGEPGRLGTRLRLRFEGSPYADRIRWLGYVPEADLPALYGGALALVYPSVYEGFGLPVLEAMSCGAPVVAARISSLPEVAGEAALYSDPDSADQLAAAMTRIAAEPALRDELRSRGVTRARRFSWAETARRVLDVCTRVGHGGGR